MWSIASPSRRPAASQPSGSLDGGADAGSGQNPTTVYSYSGVSYDGVGNLLGYTDNGSGGLPNGIMGEWSFSYDAVDRLAAATAVGHNPAPYANNYGCWSYDAFGNRLSQSMSTTACGSSPPLTSWANYDANNRFTNTSQAPGGVPYDASGDVTNDGQNQYLYDGEGRICAVASTPIPGMTAMTGYLYDADGARVAKGRISTWSCDPAANGFQTISDYILGPGGEQVTEMAMDANNSMAWQHTNVYAAGALIATYDNDGLHFYLNDPLGTRRAQTNFEGVLEQTCSSLPFGDALTCSGGNLQAPTEHHFTNKERDAESGNDYFKYRYYASSMGRWLSPDPSMFTHVDFENPQSLNLYNYVGNRPLTLTDLDGLCWKGFQWACDLWQATTNRLSGYGFQTDDGLLKHPNKRSQKKTEENRRQEASFKSLTQTPYKPIDLQFDPNAPPVPRLSVRATPAPKRPEPPGWYECLTVPGDATAAYRESMAAYNSAAPASSAPSDDDASNNGVGGGAVLVNLKGNGWTPQGDADAATKVNAAAAIADYGVSAGGCFVQH